MIKQQSLVTRWLFLCCIMIAIMVLIGGLTRLTESGLSMTGWKPVTGWLPPISESQWVDELSKYRQSPQYKQINAGMSVDEFKSIFWLEYIHRLMGRIVGVVFFLPLIYFMFTRQVDKKLGLGLVGVLALGATQGVVGWLMVSSGLKDKPYVSQYWLAFHLGMAFLVFSLVFLSALGQYYKNHVRSKFEPSDGLKKLAIVSIILVFIQIILGAFVAGLDAGFIYNTFPLMEGHLIPDGLFPVGADPLSDIKTVQFIHRKMAYLVVLILVALWLAIKKSDAPKIVKKCSDVVLGLVFVQFLLGVLTLIYVVPIALASAHQMVALALFCSLLCVAYHLLLCSNKKNVDF